MKRRVEAHYFAQADLWRQPVQEQVTVAEDLIAEIPEDVRSIFDAGCGNGAVTNLLVGRWDVIGCDLSEAALRHVQAPSAVADLAAIPFPDRVSDLVIASDVIEHVPDSIYRSVLDELARVAGRYVLIAVPHREILENAGVRCPSCGLMYHAHLHQRSYCADDGAALMPSSFGLRRVRYSGDAWTYRSPELSALRRELTGLDYAFPDALCPGCGTRRGEVPRSSGLLALSRQMTALEAMQIAEGLLEPSPRSEILFLFERGYSGPVEMPEKPAPTAPPVTICPCDLPYHSDPFNYPATAVRIGDRNGSTIIALPRAPRAIEVTAGACRRVLVFDYVRQTYVAATVTGPEHFTLPQLPYGPHGCLLRLEDASGACELALAYPDRRSEGDLVAVAFGGAEADREMIGQLSAMVEGLEERRHALETRIAERDQVMVRLERQLDATNALANDLAARREGLEATVTARDAAIVQLERKLDATNTLANDLAARREGLEATVTARDVAIARLNSQLEEVNTLAEEIETKRARLETIVHDRDRALAMLDRQLAEANRRTDEVDAKRAVLQQIIAKHEGEIGPLLTVVSKHVTEYFSSLKVISRQNAAIAHLERMRKVDEILKAPAVARRATARSVLVLSHMFPRDHSPTLGIFIHQQVKALRARGIDVRVLSGEPFWINTRRPPVVLGALRQMLRSYEPGWQDYDGVPVNYFPYLVSNHLPFQTHAWSYRLAAMRSMKTLAPRFSFDLIHAHTGYTDATAGAGLAGKYRTPLIVTEHTGPFSNLTRTPYLRSRTETSLNAADQVIAVSHALLEEMKSKVALRRAATARVVGNTVDCTVFMPRSRAVDGRIRVLWVGHFVPVKRLDWLIPAFAEAVRHRPEMVLRLVGNGEGEADARRMVDELGIADRVEWSGAADRDQLVQHYGASDFLVISSETETFGVVAIEAMSCGRPVLATDCGGPADVIIHPELGMLVEPGREGLQAGLLAMAKRVGTFDSHLIRETVRRRFSGPAVATQLTDVYADVLASWRKS